jgi:septum formation protein
MTQPLLILASSSKYRRELLGRLRLPFEVMPPDVDESAFADETPAALAERLARTKARAVAGLQPDAAVIGSDQVCDLDGQALGKPGDHARATAQLRRLSGRSATFHTAVTVAQAASGFEQSALATVRVRFRSLSDRDIARYLHLDQPYDCAGSAKCETLGITLLEAIESDDPTALVGLPLIATARLLRLAGIDPLAA